MKNDVQSFFPVTKKVGIYIVLIGFTLVYVAPFLWTLLTAVMPDEQINTFPPAWIPHAIMLDNFRRAISAANFGRYFLNSAIVTISTTILNLCLSSITGYTLARMKFPGKRFFFLLILGTLMVPGQVTMICIYIIMKHIPLFGGNNILGQGGTGWLNTYPALIVPGVASAFGVFLMRQFMQDLPQELEDAARVDGCSEFGIFWRIMLPQCVPALTTLTIFTFMTSWNDFLWPLIATNTDEMKTVQLGLSVFRGYFHTQWNLMMAVTLLISLPPIIVFLVGQRHFVRGIAFSGIKG